MTTQNTAKQDNRKFAFPLIKFDNLPKSVENGADGRSARTEWNLEAMKMKEALVIPRDRIDAATTAMYNLMKKTEKDGKRTLRFITVAATDEKTQQVITETIPATEMVPDLDADGKPKMKEVTITNGKDKGKKVMKPVLKEVPVMQDGKPVMKEVPKAYHLIRVPLVKG